MNTTPAYNPKSFGKWGAVHYDSLKQSAKHYAGENGYCSVIALAVASGCKFGKARGIMARQGRQTGCGVNLPMIMGGLKEARMQVKRTVNVRGVLRKAPEHLPKQGTFLVLTHGHVSCVRNGELHDWSSEDRAASNKRIQMVFELEHMH